MQRVETGEELDDAAIDCRVYGHDWRRGKLTKHWRRARGGKIVEEDRERDCPVCGAIQQRTFEIISGEWHLMRTRVIYPTDRAYLMAKGHRLTRAQAMGIQARRENPSERWG